MSPEVDGFNGLLDNRGGFDQKQRQCIVNAKMYAYINLVSDVHGNSV